MHCDCVVNIMKVFILRNSVSGLLRISGVSQRSNALQHQAHLPLLRGRQPSDLRILPSFEHFDELI